jgi:hypothetical protein
MLLFKRADLFQEPETSRVLSARRSRGYVPFMRARITLLFASLIFAASLFAADAPKPEGKELFNGKDLKGWKITDFGGEGETIVTNKEILCKEGASLSGVQYTNVNDLYTNNYAVTLEAMKIDGGDFFCALTFPVGDSHCSLILGGWGGGVVGLSSLDGMDASENEFTKYLNFAKNKWYKVRVEVRPTRIKAWIDDGEPVIDADIKDRKVSLRPGAIELQVPFGLSNYQTTSAWRNIRIAPLAPEKK